MKNAQKASAKPSFDDRFVEAFTHAVLRQIKYGNNIKAFLLTATLREDAPVFYSEHGEDSVPYKHSALGMVIAYSKEFSSHEERYYHRSKYADENALILYLTNLDKIQPNLLCKLDENPELTDSRKSELKIDVNEAFEILQDMRKIIFDDGAACEVRSKEIIYGRKDDGTAKAIMMIQDKEQYCGDIVEHSSVSSQFFDDFSETDIEMTELKRDNSAPSLKTSAVDKYDQRGKSAVYKEKYGKGILLRGRNYRDFVYEGEFVNGKIHGKGVIKWRNGEDGMYEGEFSNDSVNGKGTFTWKNGDTYQGEVIGEGKTVRVINEGIFTSKSSGETIKYNFPAQQYGNLQEIAATHNQTTPNSSIVNQSSQKTQTPEIKISGETR